MTERCADCRYFKKIYVPPTPRYKYARAIHGKYVCTVWGDEVMYLEDREGRCELYDEQGGSGDTEEDEEVCGKEWWL